MAVSQDYNVIVKLIVDYAYRNDIILELNEKDLEDAIQEYNNIGIDHSIRSINDINSEIIKILYVCKNDNRLMINFRSDFSALLMMFDRISERSIDYTPPTANRNIGNSSGARNNRNSSSDGDLVLALYDFNGNTSEELSINKNECIIVTNWNIKNGWAYGYKMNDSQKRGVFPVVLVRKCISIDDDPNGLFIYIYIFFFLS